MSASGERYDVTGRSMLMFVLKPDDTPGDAVTEMERSYQHVMQAFERANIHEVGIVHTLDDGGAGT